MRRIAASLMLMAALFPASGQAQARVAVVAEAGLRSSAAPVPALSASALQLAPAASLFPSLAAPAPLLVGPGLAVVVVPQALAAIKSAATPDKPGTDQVQVAGTALFDGAEPSAPVLAQPLPVVTVPATLKPELQRLYATGVENALSRAGYYYSGAEPGTRLLGRRLERGDGFARSLLKLGFKAARDAQGVTLSAPESVEELFARLAGKARDLLSSGAVGADELVEPALVFERKPKEYRFVRPEYLFVRPGKDPWPAEEWTLVGDLEISHETFYRAVADGRMPFGVAGFLFHDLAHLTELFDYPEIMRQWRLYARHIAAQAPGSFPRDYFQWPASPSTVEQARSVILAEFLSLPDIRRAKFIRSLLPKAYATRPPHEFASARALLASMPEPGRRAHLERLVSNGERALLRHGGGMRDPYNLDRYFGSQQTRDQMVLELTSVETGVKPSQHDVTTSLRESLHGMIRYARLLVELRYASRPERAQMTRFFAEQEEAAVILRLDGLIDDEVARIDLALAGALELGITPELVHREARVQAPPADSRTARYLRRYLRPDSMSAWAFGLAPSPQP